MSSYEHFIEVNKITPVSGGTTVQVGESGDTINIPSGATLANAGSVTGLPASSISSGTIATARLGSGTASSSTFLRGDQTYAEAGGTLVKTASVDFESGTGANFVELQNCFSDTYDTYMFVIRRFLPEDNGDVFNFRLLTGTNTEVNATNYYYALRYYEDTGSLGGPRGDGANKFQINGGVHNGQEQGGCSGVFWMTLDKTDNSGNAFKFTGTNAGFNGNVDHVSLYGGGTFLDTSADVDVTGVKMFCDNQIRKIHMICYGVKE